MGKGIRIAGGVVGGLVVLVLGAVGYVEATANMLHPDTPKPALKATKDPAVIERGKYVVHAVAHCSTCHMPLENVESLTLDVNAPLTGGYTIKAGPFGTFTAKNLTPDPKSGIGRYTDEELARMIRHGIGADGTFLPMMRLAVGSMSDEDLVAVMSYLRAQKPVETEVHPGPQFGFLAKALSSKFSPRMDTPPKHVPAGEVSVARGEYLAMGPALCYGCHTVSDPMAGFAYTGEPFAGGVPEPDGTSPDHEIVAPNITADPDTGRLAAWSEDDFLKRIRAGRAVKGSHMAWEAFGKMTDEDLRSIYRYLKTVPPVKNDTGPSWREAGSWEPTES